MIASLENDVAIAKEKLSGTAERMIPMVHELERGGSNNRPKEHACAQNKRNRWREEKVPVFSEADEESSRVLRMNCQGSEEFMLRCRMRSRVNLDNSNLKMIFLMFLMCKT